MADTNAFARSLHDVGLAAWFGGSLMGAIGLNGGASVAADPRDRNRVASEGWRRWTPVNAAAIGAHLAGGLALTAANRHRIAGQHGVGATTLVKAAITGGALAATAYARVLGQRQISQSDQPVEAATTPSKNTDDDVAGAQKQQQITQWVIPALTGALVVLAAYMGEQQRPAAVTGGVLSRLVPGA